jgi:hypothetical protein
MKSILFKSCLTGLVFCYSATGIAAAMAPAPSTFVNLSEYSAVSGSAMNIAASSTVAKKLAAGAALTFGSSATMGDGLGRPDIYADAAVTIGAGATIGNVISGAAAGIGAGANANDVTAGSAITLGANAQVGNIAAGAAITMGAGSTAVSSVSPVITSGAGSNEACASGGLVTAGGTEFCPVYTANNPLAPGVLSSMLESKSDHLTTLKSEVAAKVEAAASVREVAIDNGTINSWVKLGTNLAGETLPPGTYYGDAVNIPANTTLILNAGAGTSAEFNFDLSGALTFGAGTKVVVINAPPGGAKVTWTTGGSINMGAGTEFRGLAYSAGSINASTSDVMCGGLYAAGTISVKSIGPDCQSAPTPFEF